MFYVNKPIPAPTRAVQAFQYQGQLVGIPEWTKEHMQAGRLINATTPCDFEDVLVLNKPSEGAVAVPKGWWVVMESGGSLRICDPKEFESLYIPHNQREWGYNELQQLVHATTNKKGWYDQPASFAELMALVMCEAAEAIEEWRNGGSVTKVYYSGKVKGKETDSPVGHTEYVVTNPTPNHVCKKPEGVPSELADIVIRIMDICERNEIDLAAMIVEKNAYNLTRPYRHGGKRI